MYLKVLFFTTPTHIQKEQRNTGKKSGTVDDVLDDYTIDDTVSCNLIRLEHYYISFGRMFRMLKRICIFPFFKKKEFS